MKFGNWSRLSYSEALVFGFNIIDEKKFQGFQDRFAPVGSVRINFYKFRQEVGRGPLNVNLVFLKGPNEAGRQDEGGVDP